MSGICLQISQKKLFAKKNIFKISKRSEIFSKLAKVKGGDMRARGPYLGSYQLDGGDIFHQKFLTSSTMFHFCESDTNQWNFPHLWDSYQIVREEKFIMHKVDTRAELVKLWDQTSSLSDVAVVKNWIFNILWVLFMEEKKAKRPIDYTSIIPDGPKFIMRKVDTRAGLVKLWDQTSSLSDLAVV